MQADLGIRDCVRGKRYIRTLIKLPTIHPINKTNNATDRNK